VVPEHRGDILFSKWNTNKRILATGGAGDCYVNVWDLTQEQFQAKPSMQLRHISFADNDKMPDRADSNHFISSIQWSNNGQRLLTSAYDNIARVWSMQGKLEGLFRS